MVGILILVALGVVLAIASRAATARRTVVNSTVRRSLCVTSDKPAPELAAIVALGLRQGGLKDAGSFDETRYFRLNSVTQVELQVRADSGRSRATVTLPSVRSSGGRQQRLRPVGRALEAAASSIRRADPSAQIE